MTTEGMRSTGSSGSRPKICRSLPLFFLVLFIRLFMPAETAAADSLTVGVYHYDLISHPRQGSGTDLFNRIMDYTAEHEKWILSFRKGSFNDLLSLMLAGEIDVMMAVPYTNELSKDLIFTRESAVSTWGQVYSGIRTPVLSFLDLENRSVGVVRNDHFSENFMETASGLNINMDIVEFKDYEKLLEAVEKEWIDAALVDRIYALFLKKSFRVKPSQIILSPVELKFAVASEEKRHIVQALDFHITQLKTDPESFYSSFTSQYINRPSDTVILRWIVITTTVLFVIILALIIFNNQLRRGIHRKTGELLAKNEELEELIQVYRKTEAELLSSNRLLEMIFVNTGDGLLLLNVHEDRILSSNGTAADHLGYSSVQALCAVPVSQLITEHIKDHNSLLKDLQNGKINEKIQIETDIRPSQGEYFHGEVIVVPLAAEDQDDGKWTLIIRDITSRILSRQSQKLEAIGTLAGGIAHDFNNILTPILGYSELMRDLDCSMEERRHYTDQIMSAALRARSLVNQILEFSRNRESEAVAITFSKVVADALKFVRAAIPAGITVRQSLMEGADTIMADPTKIHQIILNLVTNAAHAVNEENGVISITVQPFSGPLPGKLIQGLPAEGDIQLSVEDNGSGMDLKTLRRIFDPFFTTKEPGRGTGLGLSVVHGIVEQYSAALSVRSTPGQGTAFHLFFKSTESPALSPENRKIQRSGDSRHVLMVDDEPAILEVFKLGLEALNFNVSSFKDPRAALAFFRDYPRNVDIVVTDYAMPHVSGLKFAEQIKKIRPGIPVILYSGNIDESFQDAIRKSIIDNVLMKPLTSAKLADEIQLQFELKNTVIA